MVGICRNADLVENMAEIAQISYYRGWSLASDEVGHEKTCVNAEIIAEIAVKENWFWRNSRRMVAVTSASPKAVVVASMLC